MILNHVAIVLVLALNISFPSLIFVICLIFKLGGCLLWGFGTDVILWVMISYSIVLFVVFYHKSVLPGVMVGYILWLQIL